MDQNNGVPSIQLYPDRIKTGVSEENSIIVASYGEPISVEFLSGSIDFSESSIRIVRRDSREEQKRLA